MVQGKSIQKISAEHGLKRTMYCIALHFHQALQEYLSSVVAQTSGKCFNAD